MLNHTVEKSSGSAALPRKTAAGGAKSSLSRTKAGRLSQHSHTASDNEQTGRKIEIVKRRVNRNGESITETESLTSTHFSGSTAKRMARARGSVVASDRGSVVASDRGSVVASDRGDH